MAIWLVNLGMSSRLFRSASVYYVPRKPKKTLASNVLKPKAAPGSPRLPFPKGTFYPLMNNGFDAEQNQVHQNPNRFCLFVCFFS